MFRLSLIFLLLELSCSALVIAFHAQITSAADIVFGIALHATSVPMAAIFVASSGIRVSVDSLRRTQKMCSIAVLVFAGLAYVSSDHGHAVTALTALMATSAFGAASAARTLRVHYPPSKEN